MTELSIKAALTEKRGEFYSPDYRVSEHSPAAEKSISCGTGASVCASPVITVCKHGSAPYFYIARIARLMTRWIRVVAGELLRGIPARMRHIFRFAPRQSGVEILRQSAILRI